MRARAGKILIIGSDCAQVSRAKKLASKRQLLVDFEISQTEVRGVVIKRDQFAVFSFVFKENARQIVTESSSDFADCLALNALD